MAATTTHLKTQNQPSKPKRRKRRETTISTSASSSSSSSSTTTRQLNPPTIVSPDNSWCCSATPITTKQGKLLHHPSTYFSEQPNPISPNPISSNPISPISSSSSSPSAFKIRFSPGRVSPIMDVSISLPTSTTPGVLLGSSTASYPSSYSKFNSALNAGLLNPLSPPPDKTRSSPTLFEMMANEVDCQPKPQIPLPQIIPLLPTKTPISIHEKQLLLQQRVAEILGNSSPGNQFNDPTSSDVKLTLSSKDGLSVCMNVHRQILVYHSRFFATKLSDEWSQQQRSLPHVVEISDCEDVEVYFETMRLMYCKDLRRKLIKEDVSKVLGILKVSAAIGFNAGVLSCLEYLEAVPWAEDEEEKVALLLSQLHLEGDEAVEVLKRVSVEVVTEPDEGSNNDEVLVKLLQVVLQGKDEKARREMKGLVSKMLRESSSQNDLSKESLYSAFDGCLQLLRSHFLRAASSDLNEASQIARQADNLHWLLEIMIDRQIADDFLKTWSDQEELSQVHSKIPAVHRYEVSRITARLFVGIGKGQLLGSKEVRCLLLQTWLGPFYDDFGWMRRSSKGGLDRHLVEDGLSNTILTLPLAWQQDILLAWFDRFLNKGEDCPNIQRGFQVWWRRAFWRRNNESARLQPLRAYENS